MPNGFMYPGGSGFGNAKMMITLSLPDGGSPAGLTVTVTEMGTGEKFAEFTYGGQPITLDLPAHFQYRVTASPKWHYNAPAPVEGVAKAKDVIPVELSYKKITRYGFRRTIAESDPAARIAYAFDAVGKTPFTMNFSSSTPNYGGWEDFINEVATPVMLRYDGAEDYELDRDDQTKRADGTASSITNTAYEGNAMVRFAKWKWVQRYEDATYQYVTFADGQYDDTYHAYAHTDKDGNVQDAFYWGMFKGTNVSNQLRSISTSGILVSSTRTTEVERAQANGAGYDTVYKSGWDYICDLLVLIGKSDNMQAVFGNGYCASGNTAATAVGATRIYGGFWGKSNQTSHVKTFWIEDLWGNLWEAMRGLILSDGIILTKMTPPYNFDGSGYHNTGITPSGTSGGYLNAASVTDVSGFVPKTTGGSGTTFYCDVFDWNNSGLMYGMYGGSWSAGLGAGGHTTRLYYGVSSVSNRIATRLSYIPK